MRVNLWAVTEVTAAVLPGMVERGRGAVVNMGSASSEAIPSFPLYTMYVAQFSRSLYVEYRSEGIDVQFQAPFYVATRMVSILAESGRAGRLFMLLIAPTPDAYARAAVRWIGHGPPLCAPNLGHQLLWCLATVLPDFVHDWLRMREHLQHRAVAQRAPRRRAGVPTTLK
ncbi:unnamed protein product [Triticum turgidum subsp. durum]|uniref:Uncharacterized protein n=1 Tax=Triticum turgidum subsp. durum TaxID=4567 RepID=A0A9R0ZWJ8_TRITD|nr:unnamed protein product [Triticum turgidum subsp. durum]